MTVAADIPVRRMNFEFPEDMDLVFIEDDPQLSYFFVGSWMMLPHLEPFLIRTMQAALPQVTDETLREEIKRFCAQEGQHYKQHAKANDVVKRKHPAGTKLQALEDEVAALFKSWSETKPLKFNLAYAEGFEAMTCAGARTQIEQGWFDHMKEPIRSLMFWHLVEEIEHRAVAFEAYEHVVGDWLYRVRMSLYFQSHYLGLCKRFAAAMTEAEPDLMKAYASPEQEKSRKRRLSRYLPAALLRQLATFLPWYSPRNVALPAQFEGARQQYSSLALGVQ